MMKSLEQWWEAKGAGYPNEGNSACVLISALERVWEFNIYLVDKQGLVSWEDVVLHQPSERRNVEMTSMPVSDSVELGSH